MTATTPRWVDAYTTRTGLPDPRLTGTTAQPRHCATCRLLVLTGWDAPLLAALATTDPYQLTPHLEAAAVILDIPTYHLWGVPGRYELTPRHTPGIIPIGRMPSADQCVVVAAHHCGRPPLSTVPLPTRARTSHFVDSDGEPPF